MSLFSYINGLWSKKCQIGLLSHGGHTTVGKPRLLINEQFIVIGDNCKICDESWLGVYSKPSELEADLRPRVVIEDRVYIGFYACITSVDLVKIGQGCVISDFFYASDHTHGHDPRLGSPLDQPIESKGPVNIGRNCFIGYRVSVLPGVTLGDSCVVGAHSVVTKSFPPMTMLAGIPAKPIKQFDLSQGTWRSIDK